VIVGAVATAILSDFVSVSGVFPELVTLTVKLKFPAVVGDPLMVPSLDNESPVGKLPLEMIQL